MEYWGCGLETLLEFNDVFVVLFSAAEWRLCDGAIKCPKNGIHQRWPNIGSRPVSPSMAVAFLSPIDIYLPPRYEQNIYV